MRFLSTVAAVLAVAQGAFAVDIQKAIIVSFPDGTPDDILNKAMSDIRGAGGIITHEYKLLRYDENPPSPPLLPSPISLKTTNRGFAAKAPQKIIESVTAWGAQFNAIIEEDLVVEISTKAPRS